MVVETALLTPLGWVASPLIKMLFEKAHDHLGTGIDERRKKLEATVLPRLSLAIEKAEKSPNKEKLVNWLRRLKGAYYEAEEAIDLFEYEKIKQKVKDDRKTLQQKANNERGTRISFSSQFVPRRLKIALAKLKNALSVFSQQKVKLKGCIDKLIEIAKEANEYRDLLEYQENDSGRDTTSEPPSKVFGRKIEKKNLVDLLLKNPLNSEPGPSTRPPIPIIAIAGRSGVGKTALAQYVYKKMHKKGHFDLLVWVHAPRRFNATDVIKNMIEIIMAKESALHNCNYNPSTSLEALITQMRSMLGSKKLLLVLDDFWSDTEDFMDQWENFSGCLSSCVSGSKILVTTQSKISAQHAGLASVTEVQTYNLGEMKTGHLLKLFMHYAYPSNCHFPKKRVKKISQKIAVKLKGDPGAAKLVGHELREKLDLKYWDEVAEKDWLGDNMKARIWSYQQLPQDLQRCFAICSLFPKGSILQGALIIDLWMAEGFINPIDKEKRLEDIGENYLHELVSRFFLEQVVDNEKEISYQLHDLFHDLAERVQGDDFIRIDSTNSREILSDINEISSRNESIRHINLPSSMISELKEKLCLMKNICTFWVKPDGLVPNEVLQEIFKKLEKLRVLYLPECGDDLPDSIGNLKHLRFLHIYASGHLKKLPDSICKLYHLQTLVLPNCESLPKKFAELLSLRRFETVGETMSHMSDVGRLTSLQGINQFVVRKEPGYELHQLENMNQLRGEMHITGLENVGSIADAEKANMRKKIHLEELEFKWSFVESNSTNNSTGLSTPHVQLLDALQPHSNISALTINGFGGDRFPNWLLSQNSLEHLTSLTLFSCDKVEDIPSIHESLPNCKSITLFELKNLKKMSFLPPNLITLVIDQIPQLSYFSEGDLLMKEERKQSNLEVMKQITECLKLKYVRLPIKVQRTLRLFLTLVKERLKATPEVCKGSQYEERISELVKFDAFNFDYSRDQLLDAWVMFMHCHIETMFYKNEDSKLILPSTLTYLKISFCSITSDALSTCIKFLVSLSKLELSDILTITSLPPKEVLCSLKNLQTLIIKGCYLLSSLGGICAMSSLIMLELDGCLSLSTSNEPLPSSLEILNFFNCSNVGVLLAKSCLPVLHALEVWEGSFPLKNQREVLRIGHLSCLKKLTIDGWDGHLEGLNSLTALSHLWVMDCPEIKSSSLVDKYATALQGVTVDNPLQLKLILSNETISSINSLFICSFHGDSLDDEVFLSLTSLEYLSFKDCKITHLPKNLNNPATLQYMVLDGCKNLCELEELPKNLRELIIKDCPKLCELHELPRNLMEKFRRVGPYRVRFHPGSTIVTFSIEEERNRF